MLVSLLLFIKYISQFFLGALSPNSCKFLVIFFRFSALKRERILRIVLGVWSLQIEWFGNILKMVHSLSNRATIEF